MGDTREAITYARDTGAITQSTTDGTLTRPTENLSVHMVPVAYTLQEINASNGAIQPEDVQGLVSATEFGLSIQPRPQDRVTRLDGSLWTVVSASADPARAVWFLQLRRP